MPMLKLNGLTVKKEKVWSSNTGRACNAEMIGDVIDRKYTLSCSWPPLTNEQIALIDEAIDPAFFSVTFSHKGERITRTFYAGTPTYPVYSYVDGVKTYQGVSVELIEK